MLLCCSANVCTSANVTNCRTSSSCLSAQLCIWASLGNAFEALRGSCCADRGEEPGQARRPDAPTSSTVWQLQSWFCSTVHFTLTEPAEFDSGEPVIKPLNYSTREGGPGRTRGLCPLLSIFKEKSHGQRWEEKSKDFPSSGKLRNLFQQLIKIRRSS